MKTDTWQREVQSSRSQVRFIERISAPGPSWIHLQRLSFKGTTGQTSFERLTVGRVECFRAFPAEMETAEKQRTPWTEPNRTELNWAELSWTEPNWTELNWIELNRTELNWTELSWTELNRTELNGTEPNWAELNWTELNRTVEPNRTGTDWAELN